jgi:DNA polymerase
MTDQKTALHVLRLYQELQRHSTKKWPAFVETVGEDGRLRGAHQFRGASRTGRDAGRLVQVQNFPRGMLSDPAAWADLMLVGGHPAIEHLTPTNVMDILGSTLRAAITASGDRLLVAADLASIESRVVGWFANCQGMIDIFATGKDTYKVFASWFFSKAYEEVVKSERTLCKPPTLGCPYGLSGGTPSYKDRAATGLVAYAEAMGVKMTARQAASLVKLFRTRFPEIPEMWDWFKMATTTVIGGDGRSVAGHHMIVANEGDVLTIELPSKRKLFYFQPRIEQKVPPWNRERRIPVWDTLPDGTEAIVDWKDNPNYNVPTDVVTYMGSNAFTKNKWTRISTHPGKWVEQITQGYSRDLFFYGMMAYECGLGRDPVEVGPDRADLAKEYVARIRRENLVNTCGIIMRVHDEAVAEAENAAELQRLQNCMAMRPPEADGDLILGSSGFVAKRYRKD